MRLAGRDRNQARRPVCQLKSTITGPGRTVAERIASDRPTIEAVAIEILEHDHLVVPLLRWVASPAVGLAFDPSFVHADHACATWRRNSSGTWLIASRMSEAIVDLRLESRPTVGGDPPRRIDKRLLMPRAAEESRQGVIVFIGDRIELVVVTAAHATVSPRNVLEITSIWLSIRRICSSRTSTGECVPSPRK